MLASHGAARPCGKMQSDGRTHGADALVWDGQVWIRQAEEGDEEAFFADLPHSLRHDAVWHLTSKALNTLPLLRDLDASLQARPGLLAADHIICWLARHLLASHGMISLGGLPWYLSEVVDAARNPIPCLCFAGVMMHVPRIGSV